MSGTPGPVKGRVYGCESCGGDLHAHWDCPQCGAENTLTFWADDEPNRDSCEACGALAVVEEC